MTQSERRLYLIRYLLDERRESADIPPDAAGQRYLLRGLLNIREPIEPSAEFLAIQDEYLKERIVEGGITRADDLPEVLPGISLWQGDITHLECGAIVNAANSALLGCFVPNHRCIDNAIHTFAGVELRLECARIMRRQGHEEGTGLAKVTGAYNLSSRYVIHTVGPIVEGRLNARHRAHLASCYSSCLDAAEGVGVASIAFCCISTGVFRFPPEAAAEIAVREVQDFLGSARRKSVTRVIFNVFKDEDREIYERLLK